MKKFAPASFLLMAPCRMIAEYRSVAQWLELWSPKPAVGGSSPSTPASFSPLNAHFSFDIMIMNAPISPYRPYGFSYGALSCAVLSDCALSYALSCALFYALSHAVLCCAV